MAFSMVISSAYSSAIGEVRAMWHSVLHLLLQAFILVVKYTGTTALAVGAGLSLFVFNQIRMWRSKGFGAMKVEWKEDAGYGALLTAGLWLCLFLWCVLKTAYDDRQNILMRANAAAVARDTYKQLVSDRDATIEEMKKDAEDLCRDHPTRSTKVRGTPYSAMPTTELKRRKSTVLRPRT
jgi:hypothetical protein